MNSVPLNSTASSSVGATVPAALLAVSGIGFNYEDSAILDRIDFSVGEAEFVALVGPSGCGKSTLLNLISGVLTPHAGEIAVVDEDQDTRGPFRRVSAVVTPQRSNETCRISHVK